MNIYIYSTQQADCFVVSQHFSVVRHAERFRLRSKPTSHYARPIHFTTQPFWRANSTRYILVIICLHFTLTDAGVRSSLEEILSYTSGNH